MRLDTEEYAYSVEFMCGRLGVSRSGYYDWRSRPESATAQRRDELKLLIEKAFDMSDGIYGHRRIRAQLHRWGVTAGLELVRRLMRELGLEPCQPRPKRFSLTRATAGQVPTSSAATSPLTLPAKSSSATSPTSRPGRAGCTSQQSSTAAQKKSSVMRWTTTTKPH